MCVIFFYVNTNPAPSGYKLILASNRDEFFVRKTLPAHKWSGLNVYGGTDEELGREGGTWLAISGHGGIIKVGALLNLTGEPKLTNTVGKYKIIQNECKKIKQNHIGNYLLLGRGMIVTDFVTSFEAQHNIVNYNEALVKDCTKYNGFNFVAIELDTTKNSTAQQQSICVCSNIPTGLVHYEENKCHGFGNSLPRVPFEKVQFGVAQFQEIVNKFQNHAAQANVDDNLRNHLKDDLMKLLKCRKKCWPDSELERRAPNWGEYLSSINVHIPHAEYGSRTHTVILIDANDCLHYYESTLNGLNPNAEDKWQNNYFQQPNFSQSPKTKF